MNGKIIHTVCLLLSLCLLSFSNNQKQKPTNPGTVKITFKNTVKGNPLELNTGNYINPFGETYTVSKFKYYISNIFLVKGKVVSFSCEYPFEKPECYHLVDESKPESLQFSFPVIAGNYDSIRFMLGVDSLHNVSGAQTGALDPLNDMFWTWNSGYVMAKLEGKSPQSKIINNKLEFHIGGFMGEHNVLKNITLNFPQDKLLEVKEGKTTEIIIEADIDTWWQQPNEIKIAEHAVCSMPGALAKKIADNYCKMFRIKEIIN
ncbi:MAG: hypothetical protein JNM14_09160 [Ferruginibacter sp.]|nr:hypothetical protein [Ferruginibacter sp.]